jgi:hypothetical protein
MRVYLFTAAFELCRRETRKKKEVQITICETGKAALHQVMY